MSEKQYLIMLDLDTRKRHYHIAEEGKVTKFTVQLEIQIGDAWREVVRYDCAHDFAHKDCYNIEGKRRKINLFLSYEEALTFADDDINKNWQIYRERFLKGGFP